MVIDLLAEVQALVDAGERGALCTRLDATVEGSLIGADGSVVAGVEPDSALREAAADAITTGRAAMVAVGDVEWFVEPVSPPPRLLVLGAISVADALVPMAAAAGFDVIVIDQRDWLAREERYPAAAAVVCGDATQVVEEIGIDAATSVVSLLHEARLEDDVLRSALQSGARYVGSMGSRKSTAAKRLRLGEAGVTDDDLGRLHAPIGLDLGARRPQEIAVSILAELVAADRGKA